MTTTLDARSDPGVTALYVYGVVSASVGRRVSGEGIAGADIEPTVYRDLAALSSAAASGRVTARRRDLVRHTEVLQTVLDQGAVVPLRFGTLFESRQSIVDDFLAPRHDELSALLCSLAGHVELRVRVFYREEAILGEIVRENTTIRRLREASLAGTPAQTHGLRIRLGEAVATALATRRWADADAIVHRLVPLAREVAVEEQLADMEVVRASFLVERAKVPEFDRRMEDVARERGEQMRFKYTGPLAPHSFVSLSADGRG